MDINNSNLAVDIDLFKKTYPNEYEELLIKAEDRYYNSYYKGDRNLRFSDFLLEPFTIGFLEGYIKTVYPEFEIKD